MDTEKLIQRLREYQALLAQLDQLAGLPQAEQGQALQAAIQATWQRIPPRERNDDGAPTSVQQDGPLSDSIQSEQRLLGESLQRLALLQEILLNSPAGIAVVSGDKLVFRLVTPTYQSLLPYPEMEILGQCYESAWPAGQGFDSGGLIRQMLASGESSARADRVEQVFPDGQKRSFSMRISRLTWHNEAGALILLMETTQAEHARMLVMETAQESHQQAEEMEAIITAMAEAVTIFGSDGSVRRANPEAINLFGFDPVSIDYIDLINLLGLRHIDGSPVESSEMLVEKVLRGEPVIGEMLLLIDQEAKERVVRASASPLFNTDDAVAAVVVVWQDVTERERLLVQLEIEQSRLLTFIHNAPEAILMADDEGKLTLRNLAAARLFGSSLPTGQPLESQSGLQICYDDGTPYDPRNLPLTCSALDGEAINNIEMLFILPDGQARNVLASTAPIVDRKGNLNGAVGVFQDITARKQAEERLLRQAGRSQMLAALSRAFVETGLHYNELIDTIVREAGQVFGDVCSLHLFNESGEWFYPAGVYAKDPQMQAGLEQMIQGSRLRMDTGALDWVLDAGRPTVFTGVPVEQALQFIPNIHAHLSSLFPSSRVNALIVPLRAHGRRIGALNLLRLQGGEAFTGEDMAFLMDLADRAALAIEDTRLYENEARRARELQALNQATTALLSTIDLETLLKRILDAAHQALPAAEQGILYLVWEPSGALQTRAAFGCDDLVTVDGELQHLVEQAINEQRPAIIDSIYLAAAHRSDPAQKPCSAIITPLMTSGEKTAGAEKEARRALGALVLFGPRPLLFDDKDLSLLNSFAATATAALQNATLYAEVQRLATTDSVTDQYNRRKFLELGELEIHRFRRFHIPLSAIMLDLDNFKQINDTYGHAAGDQVLRSIALRCRSSIRVVDILGRYGGDEFAILLPGAELREAREIAERIRQMVIQTPFQTERGDVFISISLGVAQAARETDSLSILLSRADTALYTAKQGGRNRVMQS